MLLNKDDKEKKIRGSSLLRPTNLRFEEELKVEEFSDDFSDDHDFTDENQDSDNDEHLDSEPEVKITKGRKALLIVLPVVGLALLVVLVLLVLNMPKTKTIQMERFTVSETDRLISKTNSSPAPAVKPLESNSIKKANKEGKKTVETVDKAYLETLIRTGAGIPPGEKTDAPAIAKNPASVVWKSPRTYEQESKGTEPEVSKSVETSETVFNEDAELPNESENISEPLVFDNDQDGEVESEPITEVGEAENDPITEVTTDVVVASVEESAFNEVNPGDQSVEELPVEPDSDEVEIDANADEGVSELPTAAGGFYPSDVVAYIYADIVNVRAEATTDSEILQEVYAGAVIYEMETNGSWSRVALEDGTIGYIFTSLLSYNYVPPAEAEPLPEEVMPEHPEDEFQPYNGKLYSLFSGVNIRSTPNLNGEIIGTMYYGDYCEAIAYTGGWFQIQWYDGEVAYVHGDFLTEEPIAEEELSGGIVHEEVQYVTVEPAEEPQNLAGGSAVVNTAMQYVGSPYVFGATGPSAFDCSGFAQYVYKQHGMTIGRSTYDQVYDGISVGFGYKDYSNLVPGDLIFFGEGTNVYHVGIYIGGGQMVHAGDESTGVVVDSLNLDFWAARIAQVRRIFY